MLTSSEQRDADRQSSQKPRFPAWTSIWPRLIELWIAALLFLFFVIRILGSSSAQQILRRFGYHQGG